MGSFFEINDTLQITKEQGFPAELSIDEHVRKAFNSEDFKGKTYSFQDKSDIRIYQMPPVRVFLVENIDGKWLYWGLAHILSVRHDYLKKTTSGTFRIEHINTPEEMRQAFQIADRRQDMEYKF